ncbi:unnamed protein product [Heterosigma akashiwo]
MSQMVGGKAVLLLLIALCNMRAILGFRGWAGSAMRGSFGRAGTYSLTKSLLSQKVDAVRALNSVRCFASMSTAEESKQFYITTPIYYVNDKPHIGHAYTTLACDIIARFMRLDGYDVKFLTGTDEHGQKIQQSAEKAGVSPQEFTDRVSQNFRDLVAAMDFSADRFIRTTEPEHKAAVQALWNKLVAEGQIYLGAYEGWYSVRDEAYYTESELVDGKAPTGADVEWVVKEPSYFFKLSEWGDRLLELYESNPDFIAPKARRNEVISFVKGGLKDLSVSRTTFNWGVGVPGDDDHIMYAVDRR